MASPSDQPFAIWHEPIDERIHVLVVAGDIDLATADRFEEEVRLALQRERRGVVLDLTRVTFIDSHGVRAVVRALEEQHRRRNRVAVAAADSRVLTVFEIARLDRLCDVYATPSEAVTAMVERRGSQSP
jgi:anti-sigma B factor antagonist